MPNRLSTVKSHLHFIEKQNKEVQLFAQGLAASEWAKSSGSS